MFASDSNCQYQRLNYKMPKLKKHSQRKSKNKVQQYQETTKDNQQDASENCSLKENLAKPKRMKMRQRVKMLQHDSQDQDDKKTQKLYSKPQQESNKYKDNNQVDIILSKYTDDDIETVDDKSCPPQKQKRAKRNQIKTKNKMFCAFEFQESKETSNICAGYQPQEYQLQVIKKQKRQSACLLDKVNQKVNIFKKKLQYIDLNKDHIYKRDIRDKLKSIEEAEQINISVQVPKVFGGKHAHLEAAIYLKNKKELTTQQRVDGSLRQSQGQEQSIILKDRRQYYEDLGKQMKLKKAETMTENILKECFKKSQLQDLDFLPDIGFDCDRRESFDQKHQSSSIQKLEIDAKINKSGSFQDSNFSGKTQLQQDRNKKIELVNEIPQIIKQKQQNQLESHQLEHVPETKQQQILTVYENNQKQIKQKRKKQRANKKPAHKKQFQFSKYVQLQADPSDDEHEGGPRHKDDGDDQSDCQDETQISSLIDDSVDVDSRDRGLVHRKYLQDMLEQEERQYKQMKQKMQKRFLQQEQDLNKRMKEAARKNKQKEDKQDSIFLEPSHQQDQESKSKSNDEATRLKNQAKLKELEQRLHLNKKQAREPSPQTEVVGINKLKQMEAAARITNVGPIKKAVRNGLHNMVSNKPKSKPKK